MKYLWDTDICIHFLNGNKKLAEKVNAVDVNSIHTSTVNIFELKFGAYNSAKVESNLAKIEKMQSLITVVDEFNDDIGTFFARNKALLRKRGITVSDFDLLIAGFASINHMHLVTNNTKHFKDIPGLLVENWLTGEQFP